MKLTFERLDICDFKSIKSLIFDFNPSAGLHFVHGRNLVEPRLGSNGCGKSSIVAALVWCLYGKTEDGLRTPDLVPWGANGLIPQVTVHLHCDDDAHAIRRAGPLYLDGAVVRQPAIDALLRMNWATFCHTVVLGQGRKLFLDLTPSEKLELFDQAQNLAKWDLRSDKAATEARRLELDVEHARTAATATRAQYRATQTLVLQVKAQAQAWADGAAARLGEDQTEAKKWRKVLDAVQRRHDDATLAYDGAVTELESIRRELQQLHTYQRDNKDKVKGLTTLVRGGICPTCRQPVAGQPQHRGDLKAAEALDADLQKQIDSLLDADEKFTKQRSDANETLGATTPQVTEANAKLTMLVDRIRQQEEQANPHQTTLDTLRAQRAALRTEYETELKAWRTHTRTLERTKFWVKGFRDLKLDIVNQVLLELKLTADAMLEQAGLVGWALSFAVERESKSGTTIRGIDVTVTSPHNAAAVKWECWSGGESQRLRVIGALALGEVLLNHVGVVPALEILDEPTQHLSPRGVQDLVDLLHDRAAALGRNIFLMDQTAVRSDRFASVRTVERHPHGTRIA